MRTLQAVLSSSRPLHICRGAVSAPGAVYCAAAAAALADCTVCFARLWIVAYLFFGGRGGMQCKHEAVMCSAESQLSW
jgi:hypothetical protein